MQALQTTAPAALPNPDFPVGTHVLINVTAAQTTFNTNDRIIFINHVTPVEEVTKPGQVLVEHKLLYSWAARTKSDKIIRLSIEKEKDDIEQLHCRAARSHVRLGIADTRDFPPNPFKTDTRWAIPSKLIKEGLATTSNSRIGLPEKADNAAPRAINGTHLHITPTYITIESVSYSYGAFYANKHGVDSVKVELDVLLTPKITGILQTTLPNDDTLIFLEINEKKSILKIKYNTTEWYAILLNGTFPDTSPFYATANPVIYELNVDSTDLRNAIQTAEMFMQENSDPILLWSMPDENNNKTLAIKSLGNEKGNYESQIDLISIVEEEKDKKPFRIAGSIQQLSKISAILRTSNNINLKVKGSTNPGIHISGDGYEKTFYVTMPIKIKDELWKT